MKNPLVVMLAFALLPAFSAHGQKRAGWSKELNRLEARYGGHLGFMAKNLKTGETVAYNAAERFPTASVIKLPILAAFFQLADEKRMDPNQTIALKREEMKPGSGILQFLSDSDRITLMDAVKLMITQSDNTATNLVLDRLAPDHEQRLAVVNDFVARKGLKDTRLLNRLFSLETKARTPEAIRYGVGVSSPADMVLLLEQLYAKTLVSPASCEAMSAILQNQSDRAMVPRFLPEEECRFIQIGNKTGSVNETKVDVALILSDKADIAMAVFVDKHPDHRGDIENRGILLGAMAARAAWNYFTGSTGYEQRKIARNDVDWNSFPGGRWGIYRSAAAPFPHRARTRGVRIKGISYPFHPHYDDDSIVVIVPEGFKETAEGTNLVVHFHGAMTDNMAALEDFEMAQSLSALNANAILVLPQGPYRAPDSFFGKIGDRGGLKHLIDDVLATMKNEKVIQTESLNHVILSADGPGSHAAAAALGKGGLEGRITGVLLFEPAPEDQQAFRGWLVKEKGELYSTFDSRTVNSLEQGIGGEAKKRLHATGTTLDHKAIVRAFFRAWMQEVR